MLLIWLGGLVWFTTTLPGPAGAEKTQAIIVVTGGSGRVTRGLNVLEKGWSRRMFISGVYQKVRRAELAEELGKPRELLECCVELGKQAVNTRTNAEEAADWIAANHIASIRFITNDWHMRRARMELDRELRAMSSSSMMPCAARPALSCWWLNITNSWRGRWRRWSDIELMACCALSCSTSSASPSDWCW
jgi:uncharacterized SAM-binding protein YcdF (DUF218 family)